MLRFVTSFQVTLHKPAMRFVIYLKMTEMELLPSSRMGQYKCRKLLEMSQESGQDNTGAPSIVHLDNRKERINLCG